MTTDIRRSKWATFNTWAKDRRKAKRSTRAHRELQQLLDQAPAALAAAREKKTMSDNYWSDEAMEARQEARRRLIARCGNPQPRQRAAKQPSEREQLLAAGFIFSDLEDRQADARAEHAARRRRADAELASRDALYDALRDSEGSDYADQWFGGGDAA
ncbi:hypothetical protein ACGFMM_11170 [Streptomyces sp. NPDC048604]|uniref:hypothetical protein n=1 Tax=Streptomyces sp. NPDC048604 TaxID=3365578 RepID=UPI00371F2510